MKQINVKHVSNLHQDAQRGVSFIEQELHILKIRLGQIAANNTGEEVLQQVERFQSQFITHQQYADDFQAKFHQNLHAIEVQVKLMAGFVDENYLLENEGLYEEYMIEERMFNHLRHDFNRFATKWM